LTVVAVYLTPASSVGIYRYWRSHVQTV